MAADQICADSGSEIPSDSVRGLCSRCLLAMGLEMETDPAPTRSLNESGGFDVLSGFTPGAAIRYFGDYELLEEIGRGGMGVVFKARQVAVLRPEFHCPFPHPGWHSLHPSSIGMSFGCIWMATTPILASISTPMIREHDARQLLISAGAGRMDSYDVRDSAGGHIYTASHPGKVVVFKAEDALVILAANDLGKTITATPALLAGPALHPHRRTSTLSANDRQVPAATWIGFGSPKMKGAQNERRDA